MSETSEATSTAPPPAIPPAWAIGAAYRRRLRPLIETFSNPVLPSPSTRRASASTGSSRAPSVSERARILPRWSSTSTAS